MKQPDSTLNRCETPDCERIIPDAARYCTQCRAMPILRPKYEIVKAAF